jgi:hypothetical protein
MEMKRTLRNRIGLAVAMTLGLVMGVACGQPDAEVQPAAVTAATTTMLDAEPADEASRDLQNEMRQRIAELKSGTSEGR